jgi:hypothetical protein
MEEYKGHPFSFEECADHFCDDCEYWFKLPEELPCSKCSAFSQESKTCYFEEEEL